jgi:hypothetical protein
MISFPLGLTTRFDDARGRLLQLSTEPDLLDVFKDLLIPLDTLHEVKARLAEVFEQVAVVA